MPKANREVREILQKSHDLARRSSHEAVGIDHLFYSMLFSNTVESLLSALNIDIEKLEGHALDALHVLGRGDGHSVGTTEELKQLLKLGEKNATERENHPDAVLDTIDLLTALLDEDESRAAQILKLFGVTRSVVSSFQPPIEEEMEMAGEPGLATGQAAPQQASNFLVDLNRKAASGQIDPVIGREKEIDNVAQTLCRRRKSNPLLVGEPGVGKTAIAEGLARAIDNGTAPDALHGMTVYQLDLGAMLAGARFRGDLEERVKTTLKFLAEHGKAILFIDEIHMLISTGGDISNMLKPALARGDLKCIGATTFAECRQIFEKNAALARRFQKIDVAEPSPEDSLRILSAIAPFYEAHHRVRFSEEALKAAVDLSIRYIPGRQLPDKAIDVIDEAGAHRRIHGPADRPGIDTADIEGIVARMARIPELKVKNDEKSRLAGLEDRLKKTIFSQDKAIAIVSDAVIAARCGLRDPEKPVGSFLFAGPTGVGKTELVRQLASELQMNLIRFDMSEYMEPHSAAKLIGAPPGYVGHDKGGLLTEALSKTPHAVLLLDEFEKAHSGLQNILLQAMDYGRLTDSSGRSVSLRDAIIIMTTNAGVEQASKPTIGFHGRSAGDPEAAMAEIGRMFSPEFRNRLDAIVMFNSLDEAAIASVAQKLLDGLRAQLSARGISFSVTDEAVRFIARNGFDPKMGARPMARYIDEHVRRPLARRLVVEECGSVSLLVRDGVIALETERSADAETPVS